MKGKINAFYGAKVISLKGEELGVISHKTEVEITQSSGKPAQRKGEWVEVKTESVSGWVGADQVIADYQS